MTTPPAAGPPAAGPTAAGPTAAGATAAGPTAAGPPVAGSVPVVGDITALNPSDGLFLRAEHLQTIQNYAAQLSRTVGLATGAGVVYGFEVHLDPSTPTLHINPGLAINSAGQSLRVASASQVPLDPGTLAEIDVNGFWVIEISGSLSYSGHEKVYGNLCGEPCSGSADSIQPFAEEGIVISLRADSIARLGEIPTEHRRNWLASQYFERERRESKPWLVSGSGHGFVAPLGTHDWTVGIGRPAATAVPLGVLQLVNEQWVLDVWTARRDVGGPPADLAWGSRLAMRPWNVFLAEVLQFQDQLGSSLASEPVPVKREVIDRRAEVIQEFIAQVKQTPSLAGRNAMKDFLASYADAEGPYVLAAAEESLWDLGFQELPPAGFLSGVRAGKALPGRLDALFGTAITTRICSVRADFVPGAVQRSQHLDRIPLGPREEPVSVDILVPELAADLEGLVTGDYGWVAFVRRSEARCDPPEPVEDPVRIWYVKEPVDYAIQAFKAGRPSSEAVNLGTVRYPAGGWQYPGGDEALLVPVSPNLDVTILTLAAVEQRRPLAALRGSLFAASLDAGLASPPVISIVPDQPGPEAIVVILPEGD
jgi:hypothetical protein